MCPPPRTSLAQILMDTCIQAAYKHPELWLPDRYYSLADHLDWSGRTELSHPVRVPLIPNLAL